MFKRLKSNEQIIEVLLSRNDVLGALNICRAQGIRTFVKGQGEGGKKEELF